MASQRDEREMKAPAGGDKKKDLSKCISSGGDKDGEHNRLKDMQESPKRSNKLPKWTFVIFAIISVILMCVYLHSQVEDSPYGNDTDTHIIDDIDSIVCRIKRNERTIDGILDRIKRDERIIDGIIRTHHFEANRKDVRPSEGDKDSEDMDSKRVKPGKGDKDSNGDRGKRDEYIICGIAGCIVTIMLGGTIGGMYVRACRNESGSKGDSSLTQRIIDLNERIINLDERIIDLSERIVDRIVPSRRE
ncbi:tol-pal system protein, putative [Babesia ovata]|uniref:Tol-pal system protein, putative n=1 Tax=Babesia ovata TaxID=189622 RepID=A0A2H6KD23_9APIC|nr:tol-pal system protein, putative [Babesia ovata]GBE60893.1 tol-pal system protein, putative [Babesia ovata]